MYELQALLQDYAEKQMQRMVRNTNNKGILDVLNGFTVKNAVGADGLKSIVNIELDPELDTKFVVDQNAYQFIDTLKDSQGRYLLQDSIAFDSGKSLFGKEVIKAQIVEYSYNPLSLSYNSITLGNFQKTFSSTITKLVDNKVKEVSEVAETALISANDKNKITHGSVEPLNPKIGDSWVRPNPNDISESQWLIWDGEKWVTEMDSAEQVKKEHVISSINISEEEILIKADKIHISGQTKIDDASITSAKILNLDAGKITAGTLSAINIEGVNITGSSLTSNTDNNRASINLNGGNQTFYGISGKELGQMRPTIDGGTGVANGYAIIKSAGEIFSINSGDSNSGTSRPIFQIPAHANENNVTANFYGELKFQNVQALAGNDLWVVAESNKSVFLGIGGGAKLSENSSRVNIFGNFGVFNGSKNAIHVTRDGLRATSAYETTESYLGDIGRNYTREDCEIWVDIDKLFSDTVNTDISYEVFLQAYDDARFWVEDFKSDKFLVKSSKPMSRFAYEIKAKRRGYENERLVEQQINNEEMEKIYTESETNNNG